MTTKNINITFILLTISIFLLIGCSGSDNPVVSVDTSTLLAQTDSTSSGTQCWGYYNVTLDVETQSAEITPNRNVMFTVNATSVLNKNPATLGLSFNGFNTTAEAIEVDVDLSITHPFPGLPQFNGYDVRGVFMTSGSDYILGDRVAEYGYDQYLVNFDGYSKWYNPVKFYDHNLFGYTQGILAMGDEGNAVVNAYKYYADGLTATADYYDFLEANTSGSGVFTSGSTNMRNYVIEFPIPNPGLEFGYAIIANWSGPTKDNAQEAVGCSVEIADTIYYDETSPGGELSVDFTLFNWHGNLPDKIKLKSSVLPDSPEYYYYMLTEEELVPVSTTEFTATYHVDQPVAQVESPEGNYLWITAEYLDHDYSNPSGVSGYDTGVLISYFKFDLPVKEEPYTGNLPPEVLKGIWGLTTAKVTSYHKYSASAYDPDGDPVYFRYVLTDTSDSSVLLDNEHLAPFENIDFDSTIIAEVGKTYELTCEISDGVNPPVYADPVLIDVVEEGVATIYLYDGTVDDGGIKPFDLFTDGVMSWTYCSESQSWDENECGPYFEDTGSCAVTPNLWFPPGYEVHVEIWHWGDIQQDDKCYGDIGAITPVSGGIDNWHWNSNWDTQIFEYSEGFDFNDPNGFWFWSGNFGSQSNPEWSHLTTDDLGDKWAHLSFVFAEWGDYGNQYNEEGWNIRKIWVYVELF